MSAAAVLAVAEVFAAVHSLPAAVDIDAVDAWVAAAHLRSGVSCFLSALII